jgi:hypothetical protein
MAGVILSEEGLSRLVQLSASYGSKDFEAEVQQMLAGFSGEEREVVLLHVHDAGQFPLRFALSFEEMSVLVAAWQGYQQEYAARLAQAQHEQQWQHECPW